MGGGALALAEAAPAEAATARGVSSEARVLDSIGETKNMKPVSTHEGTSIPDFQNSKVVGEIKDTKIVSNTRQLRIQKGAAQQSNRTHRLITGNKTKVTKNAARNTTVVRRKDLGPK